MNKVLENTATAQETSSEYNLNIRKIVVAVDLSPHSENTAAYAAEFARSFGAAITLVHALAPEPITEFTTQEFHESFVKDQRESQKKLASLVEEIRQTCPACDMEIRFGDPAEQVTRAALDRNADLIVTASHHPSFLGRLLGLDQAPRILHRANCPVLVYHEGNKYRPQDREEKTL